MSNVGYCMGILLNDCYQEKICDKRDRCQYYVEGFYTANIERIDNFQQIQNTPGKPCTFFLPRKETVKPKEGLI